MSIVETNALGASQAFARSLVVAGEAPLPVPIRDVLDPDRTPARFLPWLSAHEAVRLWFDDWPEARKRAIIKAWPRLAKLIGTRAAAVPILAFVDTAIVQKRSYPAHMPVGRIAAGISPVLSTAQRATFLLKSALRPPVGAFVTGFSAVGRAAVRDFDFTPLRRAEHALVVSKAPESEYTVTHAHRVPIALDDGLDLAAGHTFGSFHDRFRL